MAMTALNVLSIPLPQEKVKYMYKSEESYLHVFEYVLTLLHDSLLTAEIGKEVFIYQLKTW